MVHAHDDLIALHQEDFLHEVLEGFAHDLDGTAQELSKGEDCRFLLPNVGRSGSLTAR
jgi:hypothetical protein